MSFSESSHCFLHVCQSVISDYDIKLGVDCDNVVDVPRTVVPPTFAGIVKPLAIHDVLVLVGAWPKGKRKLPRVFLFVVDQVPRPPVVPSSRHLDKVFRPAADKLDI